MSDFDRGRDEVAKAIFDRGPLTSGTRIPADTRSHLDRLNGDGATGPAINPVLATKQAALTHEGFRELIEREATRIWLAFTQALTEKKRSKNEREGGAHG